MNSIVIKRSLFLGGFLFLSIVLFARTPDSLRVKQLRQFSFGWDNDLFQQTDYYYTQGVYFEMVNPFLEKNYLNKFLLRIRDSRKVYGASLFQKMYTPVNINDSLVQLNDRPYAGTLYFRSFLVSINRKRHYTLKSQFDLGVIGPYSGAAEAQKYVHLLTGSKPPGGWDNQIATRPYLNYNLEIEKGLLSWYDYFYLNGVARSRVGNMFDDVRLGISTQFGWMNALFNDYFFSPKQAAFARKQFQLYAMGSANVMVVAHNGTLMGGLGSTPNIHELRYDQLETFVTEYTAGLVLSYKGIGMEYVYTRKSPEFKGGLTHKWSRLAFLFRL